MIPENKSKKTNGKGKVNPYRTVERQKGTVSNLIAIPRNCAELYFSFVLLNVCHSFQVMFECKGSHKVGSF